MKTRSRPVCREPAETGPGTCYYCVSLAAALGCDPNFSICIGEQFERVPDMPPPPSIVFAAGDQKPDVM